MSTAPEEFEQLRKLLQVKRYEQPPPGFFNDFSDRVVRRLDTAVTTTVFERLLAETPWLKRVFGTFESNPMAAGGVVTGLCALLLAGIVYTEITDQTPNAANQGQPISLSASAFGGQQATLSPTPSSASLAGNSTDPVLIGQTAGAPFSVVGDLPMQPVNFSTAQNH